MKNMLDDFISYAKNEFGLNVTVNSSLNSDTYTKIFTDTDLPILESQYDYKEEVYA